MLSWDEFDKEDEGEVAVKGANAGHATEANMDRLDTVAALRHLKLALSRPTTPRPSSAPRPHWTTSISLKAWPNSKALPPV
jgi:hypothetical protein